MVEAYYCGDGEIRTLVQRRFSNAFYTLSFVQLSEIKKVQNKRLPIS